MTDTASAITQTASTAANIVQAHPGWVVGILGWLGGFLSHIGFLKAKAGISPADVDALKADAAAIAPVAQLGLTLAGQPAAAAILGRVVAAAQDVQTTHAAMVANPMVPTTQAHADAVAALVQAVVPLAQAAAK